MQRRDEPPQQSWPLCSFSQLPCSTTKVKAVLNGDLAVRHDDTNEGVNESRFTGCVFTLGGVSRRRRPQAQEVCFQQQWPPDVAPAEVRRSAREMGEGGGRDDNGCSLMATAAASRWRRRAERQ